MLSSSRTVFSFTCSSFRLSEASESSYIHGVARSDRCLSLFIHHHSPSRPHPNTCSSLLGPYPSASSSFLGRHLSVCPSLRGPCHTPPQAQFSFLPQWLILLPRTISQVSGSPSWGPTSMLVPLGWYHIPVATFPF